MTEMVWRAQSGTSAYYHFDPNCRQLSSADGSRKVPLETVPHRKPCTYCDPSQTVAGARDGYEQLSAKLRATDVGEVFDDD